MRTTSLSVIITLFAAVSIILTSGATPALGSGGTAPTGGSGTSPGAGSGGTTAALRPSLASLAYDLVSANGTVTSFGTAGNFGGANHLRLNAPISNMAVTPDGKGYWLLGADGGVFTYGDAGFHGSLGGSAKSAAHKAVDIVATADGKGYWICDTSGVITAFGDAPRLPSLLSAYAVPTKPIVGFAVLRDQIGAWVVNSSGIVFHLGQARLYGSMAGKPLSAPITGFMRSYDGRGYSLVDQRGVVTSFGDAAPPVVPKALDSPVVSMTPAPANAGYWAVSASGYVIPGGVPSRGGLARLQGGTLITAIASAAPTIPQPYPSSTYGYDVNWPQCQSPGSSAGGILPGPPNYPDGSQKYTVAIVGVDGWAVDDYNSCLGAEVNWASHAVTPSGSTAAYQLYLFLNSPASTSTADQTGPAGTCANLTTSAGPSCRAYNYGYNAASRALAYATSKGAHAAIWWLDVENDACAPGEFNNSGNGEWWSCTQSLSARTIQAALDALTANHIEAGIYSTSVQWGAITGNYHPTGAQVPLWIAGADWTSPPYPAGYSGPSVLSPWCQGQYNFAGGKQMLLQETPGSNNYPFDPDWAC